MHFPRQELKFATPGQRFMMDRGGGPRGGSDSGGGSSGGSSSGGGGNGGDGSGGYGMSGYGAGGIGGGFSSSGFGEGQGYGNVGYGGNPVGSAFGSSAFGQIGSNSSNLGGYGLTGFADAQARAMSMLDQVGRFNFSRLSPEQQANTVASLTGYRAPAAPTSAPAPTAAPAPAPAAPAAPTSSVIGSLTPTGINAVLGFNNAFGAPTSVGPSTNQSLGFNSSAGTPSANPSSQLSSSPSMGDIGRVALGGVLGSLMGGPLGGLLGSLRGIGDVAGPNVGQPGLGSLGMAGYNAVTGNPLGALTSVANAARLGAFSTATTPEASDESSIVGGYNPNEAYSRDPVTNMALGPNPTSQQAAIDPSRGVVSTGYSPDAPFGSPTAANQQSGLGPGFGLQGSFQPGGQYGPVGPAPANDPNASAGVQSTTTGEDFTGSPSWGDSEISSTPGAVFRPRKPTAPTPVTPKPALPKPTSTPAPAQAKPWWLNPGEWSGFGG